MATFKEIKDPEAILDYVIDWSSWLVSSDTITASSWSVSPSGTLSIVTSLNSTTTATVWLSGGTRGRTYKVVNHIETVGGREDDRTIEFTIQDK